MTRQKPSSPPSPSTPDSDVSGERLQKVLSRAGLGSRRQIEDWISQGRISLNGRYAKLGDRYQPGDRLIVNGRVMDLDSHQTEPTRVLLYHKPIGEVVTRRDPEGRPVIFTQLPRPTRGRWIAIGRLDINTEGLLLLTNNGEMANRLMHPSREIEREYAVRVLGAVDDRTLERLLRGVELDDGMARFERLVPAGGEGANRWFHVTLREGRNRIVRRLWESQNITVSRLIRIRFSWIELPPRLRARTFIELPQDTVGQLMQSVDLVSDTPLQSNPQSRKNTAATTPPAPRKPTGNRTPQRRR